MGEQVSVRNHYGGLARWLPGRVIEVMGPRTYRVQTQQRTGKFHVNDIIPNAVRDTAPIPTPLSSEAKATKAEVDTTEGQETHVTSKQEAVTREDQERTDATPQKDNANATISTPDSPGVCRYPLRSRKPVVKLDL